MAGLDIPSKLRRALGDPKTITPQQISAKLAAFDTDKDGALTREELAQAFQSFGCGGPWFCSIMARGVWSFCEMVVAPPVLWIKISLLGPSIHGFMQMQPRKPKRIAITPAGAYGWEPLNYLDGTPVDPNAVSVPELPSVFTERAGKAPPPGEPATRPPPAPTAAPRTAPSAAPRAPLTPAGRAPTNTAAGRPAPGPAPARPTPAPSAAPRRPGPRR